MKFDVFKNGKIVEDFTLSGAYIFGTDGISIRKSKIVFRDGYIECKKPNLETAGLALLWPIVGFGRVLLPTTCLPERERPYNLNIEIARARLMQIINKREDWAFFDSLEDLEDISKEAHDLFIQAIQSLTDASKASQLADESLKKSIFLSEKLAIKQAELLFNVRRKNHGFGRGCLGCKLELSQIKNPRYMEKFLELFGFASIPINWSKIESNKSDFDFSEVDSCINVLSKKRLLIGAGPLLCFSKQCLPKWLYRSGAGFEKIRETAYQFVSKVVARYSDVVHRWYVISGLNFFNHFGFNFEQILEMTRAATMAVKAVGSRALRIIEINNPWGEYYATTANSIPPLVYMDMVVQSGINFDAFGLQMQFGRDQSGMHIRDMMQISAILDTFGPIAKPLYITNVAVPSQSKDGSYSGKVAGLWHEQWNQSQQAKWLEQFYKISLSKPFVDAVTYSDLIDKQSSAIASSGLLTDQFEPKESFKIFKDFQDNIFNR